MIKNFFVTALRNLAKHKVFSFINIFGLAIGIAACLLIMQYVRYERSYDAFHQKGDRIFRLQQNRYNEGKLSTQWAAGSAGVGNAVKAAIPEIESVAKLEETGGVVSYGNEKFRVEKIFFATDAFLPMFSYRVIQGKAAGALAEPNTAVITESTARKLFGREDALGKVISRNKKEDFKVTAIVADLPQNTHLKFDVLLSFPTLVNALGPDVETTFNWDGFFTYVLLKEGADAKKTEAKIAQVVEEKVGKEYKERNEAVEYKLQPLKDIHLYSNYMMEAEVNGDGKAVKFLLIISIFIISIAWINYVNLSTARSLDRAREVGVRKALGSQRLQLIRQFLFESLLVNFLAVLLAFLIIVLTLPLFNSITGKNISLALLADQKFWQTLAVIFVGGAILSGLYPAFVLSSFRPVDVLKGRLARTRHGSLLRQILVILQFTASVALMVGTYVIYKQLSFMKSQELGVNIDQTLVVRGPNVTDSTYQQKLTAFKTELLRQPGITRIAASSEVPGGKVGWNAGGIRLVGSDPNKSNQYRVFGVDDDFVNVYGLRVLKGRNFSKTFGADSLALLFNEAAVKQLGFAKPEEALNKQIDFWGKTYTIVGVVSNHHQQSLKEAYDTYIYQYRPESDNYYSIKLAPGVTSANDVLKKVEQEWAGFFPGNPFAYFFLDDHYAEQYKADEQFGKTFALFAILAIIVACLGLYGLASFVTTQRTKEIGIRKISGATISNILVLLTKDFLKPIFLSFAIATPVTYFLVDQWLQNYAFKTSITAWIFVLPAVMILVIAIATISTQTIKTASENPVKNLRAE
jgi:putative ABC transport system permease protein